ncbi:PadR family transcriptional regulator [Candidatus Saccharibacteria bacterium]|nr:PadR family transcriptional regulator [Candidatus Saccharibacteria bacterium]MCB9821379.1 PadR family transcriptional regulator [Candidatus Nomurabacteria bacterium]
MHLDEYEETLLTGWEETYKKSQLTLWTLLALKDGPKYMNDIKEFIEEATDKKLTVDDKSMYRALRRFNEIGLTIYTEQESAGGPKRKLLELSASGRKVLDNFIYRNITSIINHPKNKHLFT